MLTRVSSVGFVGFCVKLVGVYVVVITSIVPIVAMSHTSLLPGPHGILGGSLDGKGSRPWLPWS